MTEINKLKALVIENDPYVRDELIEHYKRFAGQVHPAESRADAEAKLKRLKYDIVSIDLNLTDDGETSRDGLKLLPIAKKQGALCFILSGYKDKETIGAASDLDPEILYIKKGSLLCETGISENVFNEHIGKPIIFHHKNPLNKVLKSKFVTNNQILVERMHETFRTALDSSQNIMLLGETGVGKTYLAEIIDEAIFEINRSIYGKELKKNFQHVNLKSINKEQIEATLFGAIDGAYSNQKKERKGYFEKANGGTLFIDEIGTIPKEVQETLLIALQPDEDGFFSYTPVGTEDVKKTKFRLITGTCDDLGKLLDEGLLREDFYQRISSSNPLEIPSLRERKEDIDPLVDFFLDKSARAISISSDAMEALRGYYWPGNIRQLERLIAEFSRGSRSKFARLDLPTYIINNEHPLVAKEHNKIFNRNLKKYLEKHSLPELIHLIEELAFKDTMPQVDHKISKAADSLGIGRKKAYMLQDRLNTNHKERPHA